MPWLTKTSTHWLTRWACGHVKDECACTWRNRNGSGKPEATLDTNCPACTP